MSQAPSYGFPTGPGVRRHSAGGRYGQRGAHPLADIRRRRWRHAHLQCQPRHRPAGAVHPGRADPPTLPASQQASTTPRNVNITIESDTGMVSTDWIRDKLIPGLNEAVGDGVNLRTMTA
ncbi:MAG: hypothetical protein MZW92_31880 [Comamonadaceae bacterium]|nr:hypothetical protein [Comamonadaceae bacterium]